MIGFPSREPFFGSLLVSSANLAGGDEVKMEGELGGKMSFCL